MRTIDRVGVEEIVAAAARLQGSVVRTPLVPLNLDDAPAPIYLKLENLQPIGSFKVRGAGNAMAMLGRDKLAAGVYTASAGNMAQGVAWNARRLGVPCTVVVPDHAPATKLEAITRLGARIEKVPFDDWWRVIVEHHHDGIEGTFIHPVSNTAVIAGNGTIGLEILEDLPDVHTVVIPFGGGGLSCGIAAAIHARNPDTTVYAAEVSTAAPLAASLRAGEPSTVDYTPSFVDGIGGKSVLQEMWPLIRNLIDDTIVSSPAAIADAVRLLVERNRVVAEGAGAAAVAAALSAIDGPGKVVCVVSGGNIDAAKLSTILAGEVP
ncbi:MAG: threonine/serine dehydratase [Acidobacteriota bacterium]